MVVAKVGQDIIILHVSCWIHLTTRSHNTNKFNQRLGYHHRSLRKVRVLKPNGISTKYAYCILLSSYPMMSVRWSSFPIVWWNLGLKNEVRLVYIFQLLVLNDKHVLCPGLGGLIGRRLSLALRNKEAWSTWLARRVLLKSPLHQRCWAYFALVLWEISTDTGYSCWNQNHGLKQICWHGPEISIWIYTHLNVSICHISTI